MEYRQLLVRAFFLIAALSLANDAQAAWFQAKTKHFLLMGDGNPKQLEKLTSNLEKFDFLLRTVTSTTEAADEAPVIVYALNSPVLVKTLAHSPNAAGFYNVSARNGYALIMRNLGGGEYTLSAEQILFHEYAHHFMLRNFPAAYPAWYVEGFAEFYATLIFKKDGTIQFGNIPSYRVSGLATMGIYPLNKLMTRETAKLSALEGDLYYGTAWLLTHFFRYTPARRRICPLYQRYGQW